MGEVTGPPEKGSIPEEDEGEEDAMTNIDRVCRLIHELKKQGGFSTLS